MAETLSNEIGTSIRLNSDGKIKKSAKKWSNFTQTFKSIWNKIKNIKSSITEDADVSVIVNIDIQLIIFIEIKENEHTLMWCLI